MAELKYDKNGRLLFTKEMKKEYTVLVPDMLPIHFNIMRNIFLNEGYKVALLDNSGERVKQLGLKYTHNDICYPALLVTGQFLDALTSGEYDPHKVALIHYADWRRLSGLQLYPHHPQGSGAFRL